MVDLVLARRQTARGAGVAILQIAAITKRVAPNQRESAIMADLSESHLDGLSPISDGDDDARHKTDEQALHPTRVLECLR